MFKAEELKKKKISMTSFCKLLPKIELHAHLNGSLNEATLKKLGCNDDSISEYQKLTVFDKTSRTLEECFALFKIAHNATKTKENVYLAAKSVIEDFDKECTVYLELRTTPRNEENMSKEEYIETVIKAINDCKTTCRVLVKLILSIDRGQNDTAENSLDVIIKMKEKYPNIIKGIDLSGNPNVGTFNQHLFERARKSGLKTSIHCAEVKNDEEVKKILNFQPDRLGHAVFLHPRYDGSDKNWELYLEKKIPIEFCLTSNIVSRTVKRYEEHHIQEWINLGLPISICTDDKGVFRTTLSKEYEYAMKYFKITPQDLYQYTYNALSYSFASEEEKEQIEHKLNEWLFTCGDILSMVQTFYFEDNVDDSDDDIDYLKYRKFFFQ